MIGWLTSDLGAREPLRESAPYWCRLQDWAWQEVPRVSEQKVRWASSGDTGQNCFSALRCWGAVEDSGLGRSPPCLQYLG